MPREVVNKIPNTLPSLPATSQAVISNGNVYVPGGLGYDEECIIVGGFQAQAKVALENTRRVLEGVGSGLEHVVKVTVYLTNITRDIDDFNKLYLEYFTDPEKLPARTIVGAASLPLGAFVEIECIAELPSSG